MNEDIGFKSEERLQTNIVPPYGPLDAKICIIGEAPGEEENFAGEPFIGSAGQFQDRVLAQVGLVRSQILFNNVFIQQPPNNDASYFYQDKNCTRYTLEGQEHLDQLRYWLEGLDPRPNVLVACGRHALYALTGKKRIWKWRGSILPCILVPGYKVYASLHPSGVMRLISEHREALQWEKKRLANNAYPLYISDLERVKIQSEFPESRYTKRKFDVDLSFEEVCSALRSLRNYPIVACDIETLPKGPYGPIVWMIGFAPTPQYAFIVYFLRNRKFAWSLPEPPMSDES